MNFKKPDASDLVNILHLIFGFSVKVTNIDTIEKNPENHTAVYVNDEGDKVAVCMCTLSTAASLGCGLSMIHPMGAESMVAGKELSKNASDNLYEVMNMFSSLLMDNKSSHLKLSNVHAANESDILHDDWEACGFKIEMGDYGEGQLFFRVS